MLEDESQGVQDAAAYSATLRCVAMYCSQILLLPTPGRTAHDMKEVGSPKHLLAHLFDLSAECHTTIVRYAQERQRRGAARWDPVDGNLGSPLCLSIV